MYVTTGPQLMDSTYQDRIVGKRFVVAGASGLLGSAFLSRLRQADLRTLSRAELQLSYFPKLRERLITERPDFIINCAADTYVDEAEDYPSRSYSVNALLPGLLAQASRAAGARFVHFSSTGCYGDYKQAPYTDYDQLRPTTVHHQSKAAGELAVREGTIDHLILRLGWLYGGTAGQRRNFVWRRIVEARGKQEIPSDPLQVGSPTYVDDVVTQTLILLDAELVGTFNCVAAGAVTRFEYVHCIVRSAGLTSGSYPPNSRERRPCHQMRLPSMKSSTV